MSDSMISVALQTGALLALAVAAAAIARRAPQLWPLIAALAAFAIYSAAQRQGFGYIPRPELFGSLNWNWYGKLLGLASVAVMIAALPGVTFRSVGVTLRQAPGSWRPALAVTIAWALIIWTSEYFAHDGGRTDIESLLFQATMPGLDEELFFRGLLLALLHQAFGKHWSLLGVSTGWGAVISSALFGLVHGLGYADGEVAVHIVPIVVTGAAGFVFVWLRERTGSLLFPLLAHNLTNVGAQFF